MIMIIGHSSEEESADLLPSLQELQCLLGRASRKMTSGGVLTAV